MIDLFKKGQRYAKHQMSSGVRLYHQRHYQQAISRWRGALHRLRSADDKFVTLGYMAQAFCDAGDYESMLFYSLQQMELASTRHDNYMKSEAFLNLSKAYERLADFSKAIGYGRASLEHPSIDSRTPGYAHLAVALAQMGFSKFQESLEAFERSMGIASQTGDKLLELQVCVGLGALFTLLRDLSKALIFLRNALSLLQLVTVENVHAKYKSVILYHLSVVLRIKGSLIDAREACEEALRLSEQTNGRSVYARSLCSLADINRELGESEAKETITKSWARYEQAFRIARQINDRMAEVVVLSSMAKSASESRSHYTGQCECQAIQLNTKCLELAKLLGCKHAMMKCHLRLQDLYNQLDDEESEEIAQKSATVLIQEMELFCNFCGQRFGTQDESLQALRCSHIFHERCLSKYLSTVDNQHCPKCQCKASLMDSIDSMRTSSALSMAENQPSLKTLTFQAISSRPNPVDPAVLANRTNQVASTIRGVSTTMLDAIKPDGRMQDINTLSTFVGAPSVPPSGTPAKPKIVVQELTDDTKTAFANCCTSPQLHAVQNSPNAQKRRSAPVILPSNSRHILNTSNHKPNCSVNAFPMVSKELFNESASSPRNFGVYFETLEELVDYQGPSVTDV